MSRSAWSCPNPDCRDPATGRRVVLGVVRSSGSLYLAPRIQETHTDQRAGQTQVVCPVCGASRVYRSGAVHRVAVLPPDEAALLAPG